MLSRDNNSAAANLDFESALSRFSNLDLDPEPFAQQFALG